MLTRKLRKHGRPLIIFTLICFLMTILLSLLVGFSGFFVQ